jgi:hypothetical protein
MIDFQSIFRDPRWQRVRFKGTAPHSLYVKQADDGKVAVLVALRTRANGDWTLSKGALEFMVSAEREGRLVQAHIVLVDNAWVVVTAASAGEVQTRIGNTAPSAGPWGDFYWVDAALKPVADFRSSGADDKAPF